MPKPMAIALEDLNAGPGANRFMRCVALAGRQPGLRLDASGRALWRSEEGAVCELWVSADERLILYRPEGAPPVRLHRAGRHLDVPCGKPVVAIGLDEVDVGERRVRLHVHGDAPAVAAPEPLAAPAPRSRGNLAQAAAAAMVIGAAAVAGGCRDRGIEVRESPPVVAPPVEVRERPPDVAGPEAPPPPPPVTTIEVREQPPSPPAPEPPPAPEK